MKTKNDIVKDWLTRYTKRELDDFTQYVLLTNFNSYGVSFFIIDIPKSVGLKKKESKLTLHYH